MKFSATIVAVMLAALSYTVQAVPSPIAALGQNLEARGCTCKKIGTTGEYICTGSSCP